MAAGAGSQGAGNDHEDDDDDMQSVESNYEYDDGSDDEVQESTQGKVRGLLIHTPFVVSPINDHRLSYDSAVYYAQSLLLLAAHRLARCLAARAGTAFGGLVGQPCLLVDYAELTQKAQQFQLDPHQLSVCSWRRLALVSHEQERRLRQTAVCCVDFSSISNLRTFGLCLSRSPPPGPTIYIALHAQRRSEFLRTTLCHTEDTTPSEASAPVDAA